MSISTRFTGTTVHDLQLHIVGLLDQAGEELRAHDAIDTTGWDEEALDQHQCDRNEIVHRYERADDTWNYINSIT
ncbi:MAG: hypothetical protein JSS14_22000 [Proteobacteria bacterium]|nr:hypothetical protein [Pseudomonadota bacterium]